MQSILTKYICPTNTRGARIKASCERGTITLPWPHEISGEARHVWAADQLVNKFALEDLKQYGTPPEKNPWLGKRVCGEIRNVGTVHVFVPKSSAALIAALGGLLDAVSDLSDEARAEFNETAVEKANAALADANHS